MTTVGRLLLSVCAATLAVAAGCSDSLGPAPAEIGDLRGAAIDGSEDAAIAAAEASVAPGIGAVGTNGSGSPTGPGNDGDLTGLGNGVSSATTAGGPGAPGGHDGKQHTFGRLREGTPYLAVGKKYEAVTFGVLSDFDAPIAGVRPLDSKEDRRASVSAEVEALVGKKIAIEGFMVPYEFDGTNIRVFYLCANNIAGCCFGALPKVNEVIEVHMDKDAKPFDKAPIAPVIVAGTFEIDEVNDPVEGLICLFKMSAQAVELP
ncbi:MAG: DUF3299 domain-containing protein [Planctomycetota bacterium]